MAFNPDCVRAHLQTALNELVRHMAVTPGNGRGWESILRLMVLQPSASPLSDGIDVRLDFLTAAGPAEIWCRVDSTRYAPDLAACLLRRLVARAVVDARSAGRRLVSVN